MDPLERLQALKRLDVSRRAISASWIARNSLIVKVLAPLKFYSIAYDKDGVKMDLVWEAIGPLHELKTGDSGQRKTARSHIEQPGRMQGTIRIDDREIAIDCFSMRDTSFGPRDYEALASGGYFWGIAANSSFHAIAMGEGAAQKVIGGYIYLQRWRTLQPRLRHTQGDRIRPSPTGSTASTPGSTIPSTPMTAAIWKSTPKRMGPKRCEP